MGAQARQIVQGAGTMYGVAWDIQVVGGTKSGESSPEMMRRLKRAAQGIGHFRPEKMVDYCTFGATGDFAHFMALVQENGGIGTYFMLGTELAAGHHEFYFDFDESVLAPGVELMVKTVMDLIGG